MNLSPLNYYHEQITKGLIIEDPEQERAMQYLQQIYQNLIIEHHRRQRFFSFLNKPDLIKGLYLWGGVGVGKTFMMDCFYQSLPFSQKLRMHFHQFMQQVHHSLTQHQGEKDPLIVIAKELAKKTEVLCFDEFFVSDITDAMLLGRLLKALFEEGVCLVTTSNTAPDELYKHGLQRSQFLPAIALIKEKTTVVHIPSTIDYRLRHLKEAGVFYTPLDATAQKNMEKSFAALTSHAVVDEEPLILYGRNIPVIKKSNDVVWFEFDEICRVPRSQNDYLAIAQQFKTVLISHVPAIPENAKDTICLFISMIDVFYDARIRLVISAAEPIEELYDRGHMILEFARTHSRLLEMQSVEYFSDEFDRSQ